MADPSNETRKSASATQQTDAFYVSESFNDDDKPHGKKDISSLIEGDLQLMHTIFERLGTAPEIRTEGEDKTADKIQLVVPNTESLPSVRDANIQTDDEPSFYAASSISTAAGPKHQSPETKKAVNPIHAMKAPHPRRSFLKATAGRPTVRGTVRQVRPKNSPAYPPPKRRQNIISVVNASSFDFERYKRYKHLVNKAIKEQKIFTILGGYTSVRNALLRRGWLERLWDNQYPLLQQKSQHSLLLNAKPGNEYEVAAISKLLVAQSANFIWYPRNMRLTKFDHVQPLKSRMDRPFDMDFTRKEGLVSISRAAQWLHIPGKSELACPRSYRLYMPDELNEFMADYRFTGCTSLLAFLVDGQKPNGQNVHFTETGTIPIASINFAIKRVREQIRIRNHDDVDGFTAEFVFAPQWRAFFRDFHSVCRRGEKFRMPLDEAELKQAMMICRELVTTAKMVWPNVQTDGFQDIWILKQAGKSRGIGVSVMGDNLQIVQCAANNKRNRYIVQKYLERPLLIYNTKFDIRQYFLVVGQATSVQVWVYKACYLKFSSQEFSLRNFHESVHLTNHFVQKNYSNSAKRSAQLPTCNMWSSDDFEVYLTSIGKPDAWSKKIYPSIRQNIVAACRASYEEWGDAQKNCFELVGADFMVTESLDSLLLEVNATPDMAHSTPITAKICPEVLGDTVRVVVDRTRDPQAPTGKFEMAYEIPITRVRADGPLVLDGIRAIAHASSALPSKVSALKSTISNPVCKIKSSPFKITATSKVLHPKTLCQSPRSGRSFNRPKSSGGSFRSPSAKTPPKANIPPPPTNPPSANVVDASNPKAISTPPKTSLPKTSSASTNNALTIPVSARSKPSTPPPPPSPQCKGALQSRLVLDNLATRLREKQSAYQKTRIRLITPQTAASDIKGLGDEVNRLMDLNETIERLLQFRSSSEKLRAGVVNEFLEARQKKREIVW